MDNYEDFEFHSPLTVSQALERLGMPTKGIFYGEVNGNYFSLVHDAGKRRVNPQLTGYILPEGAGCKVFVRTQVVGTLDNYIFILMTSLGACIYLFIQNPGLAILCFKVIKIYFLQTIFFILFIIILVVFMIRRILKKFSKSGRFQVISKFTEYLDADFDLGPQEQRFSA